jgi:Ca2+-binding RTX toxin-like protein
MGINIQIHNAAHQYGLDNMDANTAFKTFNAAILGEEISASFSWRGSLLPGQSGEITLTYSGGFTIKRAIQNIDGLTAKITLESVYRTDTNELLVQTEGDKIFTFPNTGSTLQDKNIYSADDTLNGNDYNNALRGYAGNDWINGHAGIDTAYFSGFGEDYKISVNNSNSITINGIDGTDTLINIERIQFDDKKLAFDLEGNAGNVAKITGAVFGKDALAIQTNAGTFLTLHDSGLSYSDLMELALAIRLGNSFSNADEVKLLYQNLLGVEPSDSELEFWTNTISSGEYTQTSLALMAAETVINQQNIDLANLAKTGLDYANAYSSIALTNQNNIDSLLANYKWNEGIGTGAKISYSFRSDASNYSTDDITGYGPSDGTGEPWQADNSFLTSLQIEGIKSSLDAWSEIANIRFTEVTDSAAVSGDIRFSILPGTIDSITYQPEPSTRGGDVWLPISNDLNTSTKGTYGYTTFLRETGHTLGLDHPNEGRVTADSSTDALSFSIMSKRDFTGDTLDNKRDILYPTTPMLNDIAAIQYLYGANENTHSDDTIYSWAPDQVIYETIWDGDGIDTIDWSNQTTAASINLNGGSWSNLGPKRWDGQTNTNKNLAIAYNAVIENANGGLASDILTGNNANNLLNGGGGDDELHGGKGADTFDLDSSLRAGNDAMYGGAGDDTYIIDSLLDTVTELPDEGVDLIWSEKTYSIADIDNVENLYLFGPKSINATGNALANELRGNTNDNILDGGEGNDFLFGSAGNDQLNGGAGIDTAFYLGIIDDYVITTSDPSWSIESNTGDIDILTDIERLKFVDTSIAFDLDSNAGEVAKIIGAVFGKDTLEKKDLVGIGVNLIDNSMSYPELMKLALDTKLGIGYTNTAEVELLYQNLIGIKPSEADVKFWTNTIVSGQFTQTSLAIFAADNDINTTNIDLVGLTQTGIEYI